MEERLYDLIFICRPATPEEEIDKMIATLEHTVAERGGKVEKKEKWGARKMAYRVMRHREGYYVLMVIRSDKSDTVHELERRLKVSDVVIKYMTVRLDEDMKRQKRLQHRREKKAARRPRGPRPAAGGGHGHGGSGGGGEQPAVAQQQQQ
ncbi:MAG TPA: 30S ribosomal protein S6 [Candidatus Solibacter sp.]|nr:30S ribosomal protein S6 [Candidatus Solibacter sp.]